MRIAYVANYQGPTLADRRPIVRNLSMSNRIKMELVATLLRQQSHDVVVISPGEPGEPRLRVYGAFREAKLFDPQIPVDYASALPVRTVTAAWSAASTVALLRRHHREKPFDLVIIFNMKWPQLAAGAYALRGLGIPVVLEYEDDAFVSVHDERFSPLTGAHRSACQRMMQRVSGCTAVSPYLLSQMPAGIPHLLLRGVIGEDVIRAQKASGREKRNWIVFAGTHIESNGVGELIDAWKQLAIPGWELHITGRGRLTPALQAAAADVPSIVFHGLVEREELVTILSSARICINPHKVSDTPGIVFAFKLVEYLAAGAHVVTTPMGQLEPSLEAGITYLADNSPATIAATLKRIIETQAFDRTAASAAHRTYGPEAISASLNQLVCDAVAAHQHDPFGTRTRLAASS